jgi:hypothetical protein
MTVDPGEPIAMGTGVRIVAVAESAGSAIAVTVPAADGQVSETWDSLYRLSLYYDWSVAVWSIFAAVLLNL